MYYSSLLLSEEYLLLSLLSVIVIVIKSSCWSESRVFRITYGCDVKLDVIAIVVTATVIMVLSYSLTMLL